MIGMYTVAEYIFGMVIGVCKGFGVRWGIYAVGMYILKVWLEEYMVEMDVYPLHTPWTSVYIYTQSIPRTPNTTLSHTFNNPHQYILLSHSQTHFSINMHVCVVGECVCVCIGI